MSWIKKIIFSVVFLVLLFAFARYYVIEDAEKVKIDKELNFSLEEIFSQYNNLQNFVRWNGDVLNSDELFISYYEPYEGVGSSMSYKNKKGDVKGELSIIEQKDLKFIKYQYFKDNHEPFYVKVDFNKISSNRTKVTYILERPSKTLYDKLLTYWKDEPTFFMMDKEVDRLEHLLSNKVDKKIFLDNIILDSIMVEEREEQILLGNYFSVVNKKSMLRKDVLDNIEQLEQYMEVVLEKHEDEYGFPIMITDIDDSKGNSYYLGIPVSESMTLKDKEFGFRTFESSKVLSIFYKGNFDNRKNAINQLVKVAKKDSLRYNKVEQIFLSKPNNEANILMKIMLPVVK